MGRFGGGGGSDARDVRLRHGSMPNRYANDAFSIVHPLRPYIGATVMAETIGWIGCHWTGIRNAMESMGLLDLHDFSKSLPAVLRKDAQQPGRHAERLNQYVHTIYAHMA